jgi:hypothetical protein
VSIVPGQTALMRMPRGAYSTPPVLILGFWDAAVWVGSGGGD